MRYENVSAPHRTLGCGVTLLTTLFKRCGLVILVQIG